ncbi:MAG: hypothetical protein WBB27_00045, partial [Maribacter sp.]
TKSHSNLCPGIGEQDFGGYEYLEGKAGDVINTYFYYSSQSSSFFFVSTKASAIFRCFIWCKVIPQKAFLNLSTV